MYYKSEAEIMKNWKGDKGLPLASVCSITYNHESYITKTLDSFLMQLTDFPFEVLINEDCSTDNTASIIKEYERKYPHIIKPIYQKENQYSKGLPMNETFNFPRAKGKYIALCEGDDYWTDSLKLQKQVDFLEENNEYVITYTAVEVFNENGIMKNHVQGEARDFEAIELQKTRSINTLTVCFRNVIQEFPPEFQCTKFGDLFLWSLLGAYGKGKFLNEIKPARYRVHDEGVFSKKTKKTRNEMWLVTTGALYGYYNRIGNIELANHFKERNLRSSMNSYSLSALFIIFLKRLYEQVIETKNSFVK